MRLIQIKWLLLLGLILLGANSAGLSQTTKSVTIEMAYNDNAFRNYQNLSDYVTQLNIYLARDLTTDLWAARLYYDGSLNFFAQYTDRFSHYHKVGFGASRAIGQAGSALNLGANIALNKYRTVYDYTDYVQGTGYVNYKFRPANSVIAQLGYLLKYRDYQNLPEFNHFEHQLFSRVSWFLPTNTSLIFYARYGLKYYDTQTTSTVVTDSLGAIDGKGRGSSRDSGTSRVIYSEYQTPSTSQFIGSIKLGQSVTSTTGLSLKYLRRFRLGTGARYSYDFGELWTYSTEDELFDDPYSYDGQEISTALTQILPWQTTLKLGFDHYIKNYSVEALDLDGLSLAETREDTREIVWFSATKRFSQKSVFKNFQISADFYYLNNDSNDPYFRYDNSVFTFGTGFSF